jgi:hypothetical protein
MNKQRHSSLPDHLTDQELQSWIRRVAVSKFNDRTKRYFTPEEIADFEHESAENGIQILDLKSIIQKVSEACNKGIEEPLTIVIPENAGIKNYDAFRGQNYRMIKEGFEEIEVEIFAIPNQGAETMEFFTLDGAIIEERTRPLSAKEKKEYLTVRNISQLPKESNAKLYIDSEVDQSTGELQSAAL